ncbi:MAG TPA: peptidylprolyl isomerase [Symbiobacteriaceae bacterium]|nr:peptidylprolyl isomerase [Symbiobacteriaceae bacterium]
MANGNKGTGIVVAVLVTLVVAGAGGYMLGDRTGRNAANMNQQTVATVNGEKILKSELYDRMVLETGTKSMDDLIQEKLVDQEAKKANITVTPAEVDAEMVKIKANVGGEEAFKQALAQNNITEQQLKDYQVFRLKVTKLITKDLTVDDAALKKYFDTNSAQFDKREVTARHILVATEEEAKAIKAELDKGADFATLAKAKSTEPAAKESGGDLGTFGHGKMVPEFENVVFKLKKGEISAPFQSSFGWHVAQVTDIKGDAPDFEKMKADIKSAYLDAQVSEKAPEFLTQLKDKAKIENSIAPAAAK